VSAATASASCAESGEPCTEQSPSGRPATRATGRKRGGDEPLLAAARRHLVEIPVDAATAGDVLVFRYRPSASAKHVAILATPTTMIHAAEGASVAEVALVPWWRRRIAAAFAFPASD